MNKPSAILQDEFFKKYDNLNQQQKQAVDKIEGPVMVIAGPGTGKTQILACRIGKILLESDVYPENILCLTFTDSGAVAMRKRLLSFIGPDAYKVNIYTYHAFCNDIIQENLYLFDKRNLDPVSELEKMQLIKKLIDNFPKGHILKRYRGDVYFEAKNLLSLFSVMKKEGWSADFISEKIDIYLNEIPNRAEYNYKKKKDELGESVKKQHLIDEERQRMEKLRSAAFELNNYEQLLQQNNRYDFDDMIGWVIKAFEQNKNLLQRYQEKYQYILVDEFQDSSETQNKLVDLLSSYWDVPNLFVVGDDDQSIFRFQGANIENMKNFLNKYEKDLLTVILTKNYRSTQPILDVAKSIISLNKERLVNEKNEYSKDIIAANKEVMNLTHLPVIKIYDAVRSEMIHITLEVEKLIQQGVLPSKIGIIYKENKYGEELTHYMLQRNIPVYSKRSIDILTQPLAQKMIRFLQFLNYEHDVPFSGDELLFEILHDHLFKIPPIEIAKLSIENYERKLAKKTSSLRLLMAEKSIPKDLFSAQTNPFFRASEIIEKLVGDVPNVTLLNLVENILRETGMLNYVMQHEEKIWLMQVLTGLMDFFKEETSRNPMLSLKQLMLTIELMINENIQLPLVRISGNEKGVNLMTAHASKGLEFEYIFFAGCNASFWEKKKQPSSGYKLPDTVFSFATTKNSEEELRRLFFVALTRAEKYLTISYSNFNNDGKQMEASKFVAEIKYHSKLNEQIVETDNELLLQFNAVLYGKDAVPEIAATEKEFVAALLEKFTMNVTALNNYLNCPLGFYFNNLLHIPSGKSEATEFGSAVHYALNIFFEKMQENNNEFGDVDSLLSHFFWYMQRHRQSFTKEEYNRRIEYGKEILPAYFKKYFQHWNKIVSVERTIKNVVVKGVPIKGKLDKLEFNGNEVNVVDYKTGNPENGVKKLNKPTDKNSLGGDYWRQAVFYKLLVDNYEQKPWKVISTEFDFVEPDSKKEFQKIKMLITDDDIDIVSRQIQNVWQKIQAHDFYTGCGKKECHWCNFVKNNNMVVALHDLQTEEND